MTNKDNIAVTASMISPHWHARHAPYNRGLAGFNQRLMHIIHTIGMTLCPCCLWCHHSGWARTVYHVM